MSYSRWGTRGSGRWYTYWMAQDDATENRDTAVFDVCTVANFTAKELRDDMAGCMAKVHEIDPEGDTDELRIYATEFLADIDAAYPPNASLSIPDGEPGYAPGDCCAAPEDPRKTFENEYMLHPVPLAPACPNCEHGRLEERVSHGSHVGFRCVGDIGRGVERCGWKSFDLHNAGLTGNVKPGKEVEYE